MEWLCLLLRRARILALIIMKSFLKQLLLVLFLLCCSFMKAQDKLGFCPLQVADFLSKDYNERMERILQDHLSEDYLVRCIYMPSFDPEWVLQIERVPKLGNYQIITLSFEKNLWYHKNDTIRMTKNTMHIEQDKAMKIIDLTHLFLENKSNTLLVGCLDGETIQFEINLCNNQQCGATICPSENSLTGRLVKSFEVLKEGVISGTINQEAFDDLIDCLFNEASAYYKGENFEE